MAMPTSPSCVCNDQGNDARISLSDIAGAVAVHDLDLAIEVGLLRWNGCVVCAIASGSSPKDAEQLRAARESRLSALAARERYRVRQHRLQQRSAQRDVRRNAPSTASPQLSALPSALPSAAAAALARAKAKAASGAKS